MSWLHIAIVLAAFVAALAVMAKDQLTTEDDDRLGNLLQPRFQVASVIQAAEFAAEKCPGFHIIDDNIEAEYHDAGASNDVMYTPQYGLMSARGRANAAEGHAKNPTRWCEAIWQFLGPTHPPMINHTLLTRSPDGK
ncbi:hypothetical protein [Bradyrhizobium sp. Tv2a-2]|uniref:hypothetical protein n=1 Tax=Bradyrhizobium sp. Tv2a-2 TaxID=113395 RepID=UPI00040363C8|nr:hypothetical protein [Bradyrhizobium sp. Tv2a-2]